MCIPGQLSCTVCQVIQNLSTAIVNKSILTGIEYTSKLAPKISQSLLFSETLRQTVIARLQLTAGISKPIIELTAEISDLDALN